LIRGALTLVIGDPGNGKSAVVCDLIARITRGAAWPDGAPGSAGGKTTILLSVEDDPASVTKPRLAAAGADMSKVLGFSPESAERGLSLDTDIALLEAAIVRTKAAVVGIDPLSDYLGRTNTWRAEDVRGVLRPLAMLARRHHLAVLAVMHLTKDSDRQAIYRALGSVAFTALARVVIVVAADPADTKRKFFIVEKNNAGSHPKIAFRLVSTHVRSEQGKQIAAPRVAWNAKAEVTVTANEALRGQTDRPRNHVTANEALRGQTDRPRNHVTAALIKALAKDPRPAKKIVRHVTATTDAALNTIKSVKARLKIRSARIGKRWYWTPPGWSKEQFTAWLRKRAAITRNHD
jgi:hypothetical protein